MEINFWGILGMVLTNFGVSLVIRRMQLEHVFTIIFIFSFIIPLIYFVTDWNIGVQKGVYSVNDLPDATKTLILYGFSGLFTFVGGLGGFFLGGFNSNSRN